MMSDATLIILGVAVPLCVAAVGGPLCGLVLIPALIRWLEKRGY